ncbi:MAG: NAD(P)-binding oxidoreductase [Saprospiraceae bacterium]|nr:NAD(P)-binding oxidoreductase [Saprospiraceae bacterium]
MTVLVTGATGATGKWLTKHLLDRGHHVRAVVRSPEKLLSITGNAPNLTLIQASILDLTDQEMAEHVRDCDAVASCLGHTLSFKGVYGPPRRLVTEAARRLCQAAMANQPASPVKFVLMNTTGNRNRDLHEPISLAQRAVIALLRLTLPPHVDNEQAAEYLRTHIGQDHRVIEWVAVRPDGLTDADVVSAYTTHPSPTRSAIFDAGKVSRINVAHFMADLITDEAIWRKWKGQMPVIYNG